MQQELSENHDIPGLKFGRRPLAAEFLRNHEQIVRIASDAVAKSATVPPAIDPTKMS